MATRVADLYADLSVRGADEFDNTLRNGRRSLEQMGKQADEASEATRRAAIKSSSAYQRLAEEMSRTRQQSTKLNRETQDAAEREQMALRRLEQARERYGESSDQAVQAEQRWQRAQRESERTAQRAERQLDQLRIAQRRAAEAAERAARDMQRAQDQMGEGITDDIDTSGIGDQGANAGDEFSGGFLAGVRPALSALGTKGGPIAAAVAGVAAIGVTAGALLARSIAEGAERQKQQNLVQSQLGIDDATAARLGKAASEAYMGNFGETVAENMDAIRAAIQSGLLPRDASQDQMQGMAQQLSTVAQIMGADIPEVARAAGQAIKTGLVRDGAQAMDLLVAGTQKGLNINDDLLDTLNEYGTQYRKLGLDGQTALGTISQMMQGGARDADVAADALKEFSIRVVDGSESTAGAFTELGLNAQQTAEEFGKGGAAAAAMSDTVIDRLRAIEDPIKRNQLGVALFGTQWEDLGAAIDKMDLTTAANEFDNLAGTAKRAQDKMGSDAGSTWEGMRRTVEESTMEIKQTMAEAFGPAVSKIAEGLSENKDEITEFFKQIASGALTLGIAMGNTAAGILHAWGWLTTGFATLFWPMLKGLGTLGEALGGLIGLIPGMDGVGNAIKRQGEATKAAADGFLAMGDKAHSLANFIADEMVPGMAAARDAIESIPTDKTIQITDQGGDRVMQLLERLGVEATINNDKEIEVSAPLAPSVIQQLQQIGIEVQQRGEKQVLVKMDRTAYDNFKRDVGLGGTFKVLTQMMTGQPQQQPQDNRPKPANPMGQMGQNADGSITQYADGGLDGPLPKQATIQPARNGKRGLIQWAESDAGPWEAYIPGAPHKRGRATSILAEVADRFGFKLYKAADGGFVREPYGLPADTNTGGYGSSGAVFPQWVHNIENAFGVKASTYAGHQVVNGLNTGIDWSGPVEAMQRLAEYFASIKEQLRQVIWMNPSTGQQIGVADGQFVGPGTSQPGYYRDDWADHQNHVHSSQLFSLPAPGQTMGMGQQQQQQIPEITLNPNSSKDDVARKIIAEGRKRGYSDAEIQAILSTALAESNLDPKAHNPAGWNGIFQQDSSYPGRDDPNQNIGEFYNRLDAKRKSPGASDDIWENIFWLQQRPGEQSAKAAVANGRQGYLSEIQAQSDVANEMLGRLGPSIGTVNTLNLNYNGQTPDGETPDKGEPPEDPTKLTLEFDNPFAPFWLKGEKEYRQRIIDENEKKKKWDEYWNGNKEDNAHKGMKKETVKSVDEATRDLEDAKSDLAITLQRQKEMKPDAEESSKMAMAKQVRDARQKVKDAEDDLADAKANPSGYKYVPDPEAQQNQLKRYAHGDIRNGHQPEMVRPGDYRLWGEPESGGESYIPHAPDRRGRAIDLWAKTGRILGVKGFDQGGFGGYSVDTSDSMAPKNLYDLMALGVGAGMTAANTIAPYAQMIMSGKVDLGSLTPNVDLKANNAPLVTEYVGNMAGQLQKYLPEILWALKEGKDIRVVVNDATGPAGLSLTRKGK